MKNIFIIFAILGVFWYGSSAQAATCSAELTVVVKDGIGNILKNVNFEVFQPATDALGQTKAGKQIGSGKTDAMLGWGKASFAVTETTSNYIVKVKNPTLKNRDYWFLDNVNVACGTKLKVEFVLSVVRLRVLDSRLNLQKNVPVTVSAQGVDAVGALAPSEKLGTLNTGALGFVDLLMPTRNRALNVDSEFYMVEIRNTKNLVFTKYTILPKDQEALYVDVKLSDMTILVKDANTGQVVPNFKLAISARDNSVYNGYSPAKPFDTIVTDDQGRAWLQVPAGFYYLTYAKASGEKVNQQIEIEAEKHNDHFIFVEDYASAKCDFKSDLYLTFKDANQKVLGNISYNLYNQKLEPGGLPVPGAKAVSGQVDSYGLSNVKLATSPSARYLLEVCPNKTKGGCFWFANISFACSAKLNLELNLPSVTVIMRDSTGKLLPTEKFKLYQQTKDADGKVIVDRNLLMGTFNLQPAGKVLLYLPNKDLRGLEQSYLIQVEQKNKQIAQAEFKAPSDGNLNLDYILSPSKLSLRSPASPVTEPVNSPPYGKSAGAALRGKILLQVESRGEAWYVNPSDGLRYYLGNRDEAYKLMRRLGQGISNVNLSKIRPQVEELTGIDTDNDSLPDRLESALGTSISSADSDDDGYDDYQELIGGFDPNGLGNLKYNQKFSSQMSGRILLQVESHGEAWYVNPVNLKRYYLGQPEDAYQLMRRLGVGISNKNLDAIAIGN